MLNFRFWIQSCWWIAHIVLYSNPKYYALKACCWLARADLLNGPPLTRLIIGFFWSSWYFDYFFAMSWLLKADHIPIDRAHLALQNDIYGFSLRAQCTLEKSKYCTFDVKPYYGFCQYFAQKYRSIRESKKADSIEM